MKKIVQMLFVQLLICMNLMAENETTDQAPMTNALSSDIGYTHLVTIETINPDILPFDERLLHHTEYRGNSVFENRFGPISSFYWIRKMDEDGSDILDTQISRGKGSFKDALEYGLREAAVTHLAFDEWQNSAGNFFKNLIWGSVGNTIEEQSDPLDPILNPPLQEELELSGTQKKKILSGGFRIFSDRPYGYAVIKMGHAFDQDLLTLSTRLYAQLLKHPSDIMRIETRAIIPLAKTCHLIMGVKMFPTAQESRDQGPRTSVIVTRKISGRSFWSFGFQSRSEGYFAAASFSSAW